MRDWGLFWTAIGAISFVIASLAAGAAYFVKFTVMHELERFENRFLERLNGRYLQTKIAETLIKRGDERHESIEKDIDNLYKLARRREAE